MSAKAPSLERCLAKAFCPVERYGARTARELEDHQSQVSKPTRTTWTVLHDGKPWADFEFALAGEYNVWNATAAAALAAIAAFPKDAIAEALEDLPKREAPPRSEGRSQRHHHHRRFRASSHGDRADD